jgi:hypothetical protein
MIDASRLAQLEAWVQEETGAQRRLARLLEAEERALVSGTPGELDEALQSLESEMRQAGPRAARRTELLRLAARDLGVAPAALTIRSAAGRLGERGERLARLRAELAEAARGASRAARKVGVLARWQQAANHKMLGEIGALVSDGRGAAAGVMLDAEA